jgi:hypothetical protein
VGGVNVGAGAVVGAAVGTRLPAFSQMSCVKTSMKLYISVYESTCVNKPSCDVIDLVDASVLGSRPTPMAETDQPSASSVAGSSPGS